MTTLFWRALREGAGSGPTPPWQREAFADDGVALDAAQTPDTCESRLVYVTRSPAAPAEEQAWLWRAGEARRLPRVRWRELYDGDSCADDMPRNACWPTAWESSSNGLLMMANLRHISNIVCLRAALRCVRWVIETTVVPPLHPIVHVRLAYLEARSRGQPALAPYESDAPDVLGESMPVRWIHFATNGLLSTFRKGTGYGQWSDNLYGDLSGALGALEGSPVTRSQGLAKFAEILRDEIGDAVFTKLAQPNRRRG